MNAIHTVLTGGLLLSCTLLTPGLAGGGESSAQVSAAPRVIQGPTIRIGGDSEPDRAKLRVEPVEAFEGESIIFRFEVVNEGDEMLEVSVEPSRREFVATFDRQVSVGGVGEVEVRLDTAGLRWGLAANLWFYIKVPTGLKAYHTDLEVAVKEPPSVEILPKPFVKFHVRTVPGVKVDEKKGGVRTKRLSVVASQPMPGFEVTSVESSAPFLQVEVHEIVGAGLVPDRPRPQYELRITLGEDVPAGAHRESVTVHTNHPDAARLTVDVVAVNVVPLRFLEVLRDLPEYSDVSPYVEARPPPVVQIESWEDELGPACLAVVAAQPMPDFQVLGVECSSPYVQAKVTAMSGALPGNGRPELPWAELELRLAADSPTGSHEFVITALTNHPDAPRVPLWVKWWKRGGTSFTKDGPHVLSDSAVPCATELANHDSSDAIDSGRANGLLPPSGQRPNTS